MKLHTIDIWEYGRYPDNWEDYIVVEAGTLEPIKNVLKATTLGNTLVLRNDAYYKYTTISEATAHCAFKIVLKSDLEKFKQEFTVLGDPVMTPKKFDFTKTFQTQQPDLNPVVLENPYIEDAYKKKFKQQSTVLGDPISVTGELNVYMDGKILEKTVDRDGYLARQIKDNLYKDVPVSTTTQTNNECQLSEVDALTAQTIIDAQNAMNELDVSTNTNLTKEDFIEAAIEMKKLKECL